MKTTFLLSLLLPLMLFAQVPDHPDSFYVMFYNAENFFDIEDNPLKNDDAFTPTGTNRWTYKRMIHKRNQLLKVFFSLGGWNPPPLIGLAEIENEKVLSLLCYQSQLKKFNYHYVYYESPDSRGINVALLYCKDQVEILESAPIPIRFPFDTLSKNRDILYVKTLLYEEDTLHLFINHWTSRYGGYAPTMIKREYYAQVLRNQVDSLLAYNPESAILIMGDFNDYPTDRSIQEVLNAGKIDDSTATLVNLMLKYNALSNVGTHKSGEFWGCLDQMILSRTFFDPQSKLQVDYNSNNIYDAPFLLIPDEKNGGFKNFRTYEGMKYKGGFSDHLPIFVKIERVKSVNNPIFE